VHVSQLSDRFIKDPNEVVKVGDKLSVRVLEVDLVRKRIALSAKRGSEQKVGGASGARPAAPTGGRPDQNRRPQGGGQQNRGGGGGGNNKQPAAPGFTNNPFAAHFRK
jgi:uncharacterized protein